MNPHPALEKSVNWLLNDSLQAGVLVLLVLFVQWIFRRQLTSRWRFALWWVVILRLVLPFGPESAVSVFNFFRPSVALEGPRYYALVQPAAPAEKTVTRNSPVPATRVENGFPSPSGPGVPSSGEPDSFQHAGGTPVIPGAIPRHSLSFDDFLIPGLAGLWFAGVLTLSGCVLAQLLRFRKQLSRAVAPHARPSNAREERGQTCPRQGAQDAAEIRGQSCPRSAPALLELLDDCRRELGVARRVELLETDAVTSPALFGFFELRLLLPRGLAEKFTSRELRYIFLHELAHVKRGDLWLNWLVTALQIVHWFNPLVWLGFARLRADRELACDEIALLRAGEGTETSYGETIIKLLEGLSRPKAIPGLVGILEDKKQMRRRISMIANFRRPSRWSALAVVLLFALAAAALTNAQNKNVILDKTKGKFPSASVAGAQSSSSARPRPIVTNGRAMKVTVLDAETGLPIFNAQVFAPNHVAFFGHWEHEQPAPRWTTDNNGVATIHLGETPQSHLQEQSWFPISIRREGYAPRGLSWSAENKDVRPEMPHEITVRLERGLTVGGVVRDEQGGPLEEIRVQIFGSGYWQGFRQEFPEFWTGADVSPAVTTDAAGRWQVKDFPRDLDIVRIELIRPDGSNQRFIQEGETDPSEHGEPINLVDLRAGKTIFVLKSGSELRGVVVDPEGRPLPGVLVKAGYGASYHKRVDEFHTDAAGRFELHHLVHQQIILTASAVGFAITSAIIDLSTNSSEVRLEVAPLRPLHISILDGEGQAIARANVRLDEHRSEGQLLDFEAETDRNGMLIWTNAPVSSFELVTSSRDLNVHQTIRVAPEQREITFRLRKGMEKAIVVNGQVRSAKTGLPVKLDSISYQTGDHDGFRWEGEKADSGFKFSIPETRFRPGGMFPSFQLQLKANGYATLITPWRDFDEGDWDASFVMQPTNAWNVSIWLPDGRPASGARVSTRDDELGGNLHLYGRNQYSGGRMVETWADDDGKFVVPSVPDDQPVVFVHMGGFLATTLAEIKRTRAVRLQPWGSVEGKIIVDGKPKSGVRLNLSTLLYSLRPGFFVGYNTTSAADGSFVFLNVPPGEYKLWRGLNNRESSQKPVTESHLMPITVKYGENVRVEYGENGRAVIGRATPDKPGMTVDWRNDDHVLIIKQPPNSLRNPEDFATYAAFREANEALYTSPARIKQAREARTYLLEFEKDGSFRADDVPPGTYELRIRVTKSNQEDRQFSPYPRTEDELGSLVREVVVPRGTQSFDLGTLVVPMKNPQRRVSQN